MSGFTLVNCRVPQRFVLCLMAVMAVQVCSVRADGELAPCCLDGACVLETASACLAGGGTPDEEASDCLTSDTCVECPLLGASNCQQAEGTFILQVDRAYWPEGGRSIDDFSAASSGPLDRICWWPAFFNPTLGLECYALDQQPPDNWQMRLYTDAGGLPGSEIGSSQVLDPDAKVSLGDTSRIWLFSAPVETPPTLDEGSCYWLEISGEGNAPDGCSVYWATSADGNQYSIRDGDGIIGPDDVLTQIGMNPPDFNVDLRFCVSVGMDGPGCGEFTGACCEAGEICTDGVSAAECAATGGVYRPGESCGAPDVCPPECEAPLCVDAVDLNAPGEACESGFPCQRDYDVTFCDSTPFDVEDCEVGSGNTGTTSLGAVSWFAVTPGAGETGTCTVSACSQNNFDGVIAVYEGCPSNPTTDAVGCGDDTCGEGGGPATVSWTCCEGVTYLVAAGGWNGESGSGVLEFSIDVGPTPACGDIPATPLGNDAFDVEGTVKECETDTDCKLGETGPDPQTVCRDSSGDGEPNACYVARNKVLSVRPNGDNAGGSFAYRISLRTGPNTFVPLGFADEPFDITTFAPGPSLFHVSKIVDSPFYTDWTALEAEILTIADCEVSPANEYAIQVIAEGDDTQDESRYSLTLLLPTVSLSGDVTGGGGNPPNGSVTLVDVFAAVCGFGAGCSGVPHDWLELDPVSVSLVVNLADAFRAVQGFQTVGEYGGPEPLECP
ncbi:MAG: hypothetical protein ACPGXK_12385 [Phycisphaerae bacterium]